MKGGLEGGMEGGGWRLGRRRGERLAVVCACGAAAWRGREGGGGRERLARHQYWLASSNQCYTCKPQTSCLFAPNQAVCVCASHSLLGSLPEPDPLCLVLTCFA